MGPNLQSYCHTTTIILQQTSHLNGSLDSISDNKPDMSVIKTIFSKVWEFVDMMFDKD